jgi:hypothetical protein
MIMEEVIMEEVVTVLSAVAETERIMGAAATVTTALSMTEEAVPVAWTITATPVTVIAAVVRLSATAVFHTSAAVRNSIIFYPVQ